MIEENHDKTPVRLVGTGIWTRDLPNASLVRYHGATSLGSRNLRVTINNIWVLQACDSRVDVSERKYETSCWPCVKNRLSECITCYKTINPVKYETSKKITCIISAVDSIWERKVLELWLVILRLYKDGPSLAPSMGIPIGCQLVPRGK